MENLYVIVKTSVYNHEIIGVFTSERKAVDALLDLYYEIRQSEAESYYSEFDGHHEYDIIETQPDKLMVRLNGKSFAQIGKMTRFKYQPLK